MGTTKKVSYDLSDEVAIVTGGSSGIGKACVERLCQNGCKVTFTGISEAGLTTKEEFEKEGFAVDFLQGDMGDEAFCKKIVEQTKNKWGKINYLVNNAFPFISRRMDATRDDWLKEMTRGPIAYTTMVQFTAPHMMEQSGSSIVNISSISGHIAQPNRWTYNGAKGAVQMLTKCMALDLSPKIRVNTVTPAWIWTRVVEKSANYDKEKWGLTWGEVSYA